jgi:hypothetical protein
MGDKRGAYRVSVGKPGEKNHLEDQGMGGRIILKRIYKELVGWGHGLE